ncbi:MAG: hypothetical protein Q9214_003086 [Letrouitia sp. 1 TL-2023]
MGLPEKEGFFFINVNLIGSAASGKPSDQISYKVIAYIPGYNGKLTGFTSLPYREKIAGNFLGGLQVINWGKNQSSLPGENNSPQSPFPAGINFSFLIDGTYAKNNPATGTLVGFGQAADSSSGVNMCIYNVAAKDQKILVLPDNFEVYVQYVCTNGNVPQKWAS